MDEFVIAVSPTGKKRRIPAHWLDHPVLGKGWRLPPSHRTKKADPAPADPASPDDAAPDHGVDATPTSATTGDTETPAAGGEQEN